MQTVHNGIIHTANIRTRSNFLLEIPHSSVVEDPNHLACAPTSLVENSPQILRTVYNNGLLELRFPEDGGTKIPRNAGN
jgi:hypothetical protein